MSWWSSQNLAFIELYEHTRQISYVPQINIKLNSDVLGRLYCPCYICMCTYHLLCLTIVEDAVRLELTISSKATSASCTLQFCPPTVTFIIYYELCMPWAWRRSRGLRKHSGSCLFSGPVRHSCWWDRTETELLLCIQTLIDSKQYEEFIQIMVQVSNECLHKIFTHCWACHFNWANVEHYVSSWFALYR